MEILKEENERPEHFSNKDISKGNFNATSIESIPKKKWNLGDKDSRVSHKLDLQLLPRETKAGNRKIGNNSILINELFHCSNTMKAKRFHVSFSLYSKHNDQYCRKKWMKGYLLSMTMQDNMDTSHLLYPDDMLCDTNIEQLRQLKLILNVIEVVSSFYMNWMKA